MCAEKKNNVRQLYNLADNEGIAPESFEKQMADLGVPIEKVNKKSARVLSDWIMPGNTGGRHSYDLSLRKNRISINSKLAARIAGDKTKIKLAFRVIEFEGKPALLFRENKSGFSLKRPGIETRAWQVNLSPGLKAELEKYGVEYGHYTVNIVKDNYMAVHDG